MKRDGPKVELNRLRRLVREAEDQFVKSHLGAPKLSPPSRREILDVAAYVVLIHGAFENFVEGLALWVLGRSVNNWTMKKRTTRSTASLLLYQGIPPDDAPGQQLSVYDNLRNSLDLAKTRVSGAVQSNNGIEIQHLRSLFLPLGVNVPDDPILTASLNLLVKMRHQWAHQYRYAAIVTRSANDARTTVSDCLTLAQKLSAEVAALRP
jgi:hypothetical protein